MFCSFESADLPRRFWPAGYMHLDARVIDTCDGTNGSIPANVHKNTATLFATYALIPIGGGPG